MFSSIPCGEEEMFLFSGKEGKVFLAGGEKCFLGWREESIRSRVERGKCSFFQRERR
jgi:hypothetical protein